MQRSFHTLASAMALTAIFVIATAGPSVAADYYVSWDHGSDANQGLSPETAWRSLARVNRFPFHAGDRILLHSGEAWHEQLRPLTSGTPDQPIVFSSYGTGARPILEGSRGDGGATASRASRMARKSSVGDVAIDNNDQSHIAYEGLELKHVLEGFRIYVWSATVRDITLRNCRIEVVKSVRDGPSSAAVSSAAVSSAAVYANVRTGKIADLRILGNHLVPYPHGLEHWGIYLVAGVEHFQIDKNVVDAAGEDGITVWHAAYGEISHNQGGGNGENTIDVKDSHDIVIRDNAADLDREYNIVVHSVDDPDSTYNVRVDNNHCSRGGQGGELSAGIALLFVQKSGIENNTVDSAFGEGILIKDAGLNPGNWASGNRLVGNGVQQKVPAIVLQGSSTAKLLNNTIFAASEAPK